MRSIREKFSMRKKFSLVSEVLDGDMQKSRWNHAQGPIRGAVEIDKFHPFYLLHQISSCKIPFHPSTKHSTLSIMHNHNVARREQEEGNQHIASKSQLTHS